MAKEPPYAARVRRTFHMVPPTPLMVIFLGVAVTLLIGAIALVHLAKQGKQSSRERASVLASAAAARMDALSRSHWHEFLERLARRANATVWLIDVDAKKVVDEASDVTYSVELDPSRIPKTADGELQTNRGTSQFASSPLHSQSKRLSLVVAVDNVDVNDAAREMIQALLTLAALFLTMATLVALAVARDVQFDVNELKARIDEIADRGRGAHDPARDTVPVQSLDEVGELASAFNALVARFHTAETQYADALSRIEELDRERSSFLATVSHELRSPLNAILGFADILLSEVDGPLSSEAREEVAVIKQSGLHLLGLINDILDLSAIASGQITLNRESTDVVSLAREVCREAIGLRGERRIQIRVVAPIDRVDAEIDKKRTRQMLTNLVSNAIKVTSLGEVVVTVITEMHYVRISVRDTGPGIPPEQREAIFDEFKQGGDRRSRRAGTGLGLAIVRRLALLHGGGVSLESKVGEGSTFTIRLPLRARRQANISVRPGENLSDRPLAMDETGEFTALPSITAGD